MEPENRKMPERGGAGDDGGGLNKILNQIWRLINLLPRLIWKLLMVVGNLTDTTDIEKTQRNIREGIRLKGYNVWILVASAIIAAIGLDTNSAAVIIGAMLISPLMSPILGIGLSVGTFDRQLLLDSLKNFGSAILIALLASAAYFLVTPLGDLTPELQARTTPTLLDVGIAFFGGVAGIVAGSRKDATNAIPGVAIATALMPPLCTAGYGLATFDMPIFLGAFYLFLLNSVFISLATLLIVRFLGFPVEENYSKDILKRLFSMIAVFVIIVCIPSGILLYDVVKKHSYKLGVKSYVEENFNRRDDVKVQRYQIDETAEPKGFMVTVILAGDKLPQDSIEVIESKMGAYDLSNTSLKVIQTGIDDSDLKSTLNIADQAVAIGQQNQIEVLEMKSKLDSLQKQLDAAFTEGATLTGMGKEIRIVFPDLKRASLSNMPILDLEGKTDTIPSVVIEWDQKVRGRQKETLENRLYDYMKIRMAVDTLQILHY